MNVDISKAVRLMKVVELAGVRLIESHSKSIMAAGEEIAEVIAEFNFRGGPVPQPLADRLLIHTTIEILVRQSKSTEPVVTMAATYELQYVIPAETVPTKEEVIAFSASNAIFNVWPYWREFVQSTFLRMGHPPLVLPVFRLENAGQLLTGTNPSESAKQTA